MDIIQVDASNDGLESRRPFACTQHVTHDKYTHEILSG